MAAGRDDVGAVAVFKALADSTRRQVLLDLSKGELAAGDIASRFPISGPSVSRHLAVLKAAGLLTERREANRVLYSLVPDRLARSVGSFLSTVCPEQAPVRRRGKKKTKGLASASVDKASAKSADKAAGKEKRRRALVKGLPVPVPAPALADVAEPNVTD